MIQGLTLEEIAKDVIKQSARKRDFHVPTDAMHFGFENGVIEGGAPCILFLMNGEPHYARLSDYAFRQICEFAGIPAKYIERMSARDSSTMRDLIRENVQVWLKELAERRFIRTYAGDKPNELTLRAFLSDKYRPLDYLDELEAILPVAREAGLEVITSKVTESRLYLQCSVPRIKAKIEQQTPSGHTIVREQSPLVVISNSEVGAGSLRVEWGLYDSFCTNGLLMGNSIRKTHLGRQNAGGGDGDASEFFSDDTKKLTDAALWAQIRDVVRAACDEVRFRDAVAKMDGAQTVALPDVQKATEVVQERFGMNESEKGALLNHLLGSGDGATLFGLVNAVTRTAQDAESYDRAVELQRFGGELLNVKMGEVAKWTN